MIEVTLITSPRQHQHRVIVITRVFASFVSRKFYRTDSSNYYLKEHVSCQGNSTELTVRIII